MKLIQLDHSSQGGEARLEAHLSDVEMRAIRHGDLYTVIMNVWRPLQTVENAPLLLCDRQTVHKSDLLEVDKVQPGSVTQDLYLQFTEGQRWFYLSQQKTDEITLFVGWQPKGMNDEMAGEDPPY
jgi:hypothetical protein